LPVGRTFGHDTGHAQSLAHGDSPLTERESDVLRAARDGGTVAEPGLRLVTPGSGAIIAAPVSDCHHVSTIGSSSRPKFRRNHTHASGLMASPTVPSRRNVERSCPVGRSAPNQVMKVRISVGAV
jgi:hypothetical protein